MPIRRPTLVRACRSHPNSDVSALLGSRTIRGEHHPYEVEWHTVNTHTATRLAHVAASVAADALRTTTSARVASGRALRATITFSFP